MEPSSQCSPYAWLIWDLTLLEGSLAFFSRYSIAGLTSDKNVLSMSFKNKF